MITGALGAIGAWTMRSLLDRGHRVIALDLGGDGHRLALALTPEQREAVVRVDGDITELATVETVLAEHEADGVIHLAALQVPFVRADPVRGAAVNVLGTVNVLEAVRRRAGMGPVVYASSIAVYGPGGTRHAGDAPGTLYGVFKRDNEATALRYHEDFGVSSIGLRPHTVYGPARDQGVTSAPTVAMLAAAAQTPYRIPFGGTFQLQYAPDVGEVFARAALLSYAGACVHDLDGDAVTIGEVVAMIEAAAPEAAGLISVGDGALPLVGAVDGSSLVALLGGSAMRPAREGIADAIARFRLLLDAGLVTVPELA